MSYELPNLTKQLEKTNKTLAEVRDALEALVLISNKALNDKQPVYTPRQNKIFSMRNEKLHKAS